jgi:hypothetical protein
VSRALAAAPAFDRDRAGHHPGRMAERIYFFHPPRDNFAVTMTEEWAAFAAHAQWLGGCWPTGC